MRTIDRQLQNEFNETKSRWGNADTYDHTRGIPHSCKNGGNRGRNDSHRTCHRNNRLNRRWVNCAVGDDAEDGEDNERYYDGDWDNSDYQWGLPISHVNFTGNDNNYSLIDL